MTDNQTPEALIPEDAEQRAQWDNTLEAFGGNRLAAISCALEIYGAQQPKQGSFSKHLICMSNDCAALADTVKENELLRRELDCATNGKWSEMEIDLINLKAKIQAIYFQSGRPEPQGDALEYQALSEMLDREIERTGTMESFMIRAGLLREILDALEAQEGG